MGQSGSANCTNVEDEVKKFSVEVERAIQQAPILSSLSKAEQKELASQLTRRKYKAGQNIIVQGEAGKEYFVIAKGKCEVKTKADGKVAELSGGDYFGEQALLDKDNTRNATVTCITDVLVLVTNREVFSKLINKKKDGKARFQKKKRQAVLTAWRDDEKDDIPENAFTDKDEKMRSWLVECVKDNLMFMDLDLEQKQTVINKMYLEKIPKGTEIITQGDVNASTFYVINKGSFDIYVDKNKVVTFKTGNCFGELALMYDAPRAATVTAAEDSQVWTVTRQAFRSALRNRDQTESSNRIGFLKTVKQFSTLRNQQFVLLSQACTSGRYNKGTVIFKEGDMGDRFYIVEKGEVEWKKANGEKGSITKGMYFGERALMKEDKRAATITCRSNVTCLELTKRDFTELLGDDDVMKEMKLQSTKEDEKSEAYRKSVAESKGKRSKGSAEEDTNTIDPNVCTLNELKTIGVLGKGAFGTVSLVVDKKNKKSYALKAIKKCQIVELGQQEHIVNEKDVMAFLNNPFLVNLRATYKDKLRVYFLLDVCLGGELFGILRKRRCFSEDTSRFYTACVVEAFAYMHSKDIIYRDLKPENLVMDGNGYLKVTDFGFAKKINGKTYTLCGTPDYLAPEIVTGQGHGKGVDWWTLGILIYEMLASFPPFYDEEALQTYRKIVKGKVKFPRFFSPAARDIIKAFLKNKPTKRLGILSNCNTDRIRTHEWFAGSGFSWNRFRAFKMKPPIKPNVKAIDDLSNFDPVRHEEDDAKPVRKEDDFDETF